MPTQEMKQTMPQVPMPALMLEQTRFFRAPRSRVYEAWTNPEILKQWLGSVGNYIPVAELDVRVGGAYRIEFDAMPDPAKPVPSGRQVTATGRYTKVVPDELLEFTWQPSFLPDEESIVTITLLEVDGGTELTLRHDRMQSEQSRTGHGKGWADSLNNLAQVLARS